MPVETGPTLYLPHSQKYEAGYVAFHLPEFTRYVEAHYVQLPLEKGDAAFFNPALFHGAGSNHSADVRRMANLLQVSSALGRAMESVDRTAMCKAVYPPLLALKTSGAGERLLRNVVAASAEGYSFPTNLDRDQPVGGLGRPEHREPPRLRSTGNRRDGGLPRSTRSAAASGQFLDRRPQDGPNVANDHPAGPSTAAAGGSGTRHRRRLLCGRPVQRTQDITRSPCSGGSSGLARATLDEP
jgi:hypothetical protein